MFDTFLYTILTFLASLLSLVVLIVFITVLCVKKRKIKVRDCIIIFICLLGLYLQVPWVLLSLGYTYGDIDYLKKAVALSINPYEKRLCYNLMSDLYASQFKNEKDGNKAIEYREKAIKGEYEKYRGEVGMLLMLYSIKGDADKVIELNQYTKNSWALLRIYIVNDDYDKAIKLLEEMKPHYSNNLLLADLYRLTGDVEKAKLINEQAQKEYEELLASYSTEDDKQKVIKNSAKYMSIEAYKNWQMEQQKEYKFVE